MALVKVFKEKDNSKYKHTFKTQLDHLEYLMTKYVNKEEKVLSKEYSGINCDDDPKSAYQDFINTKINFDKYDPTDENSREFKHYTISFNHEESKKLGARQINNMCKEICERIPEFNNFQISIATHEDKEHIHSHIIVNSVNMVDGKKIQLSKDFITKFQYICNEYTKEHNLSTHTLPYELQYGDKNVSFDYIDYNKHQNGTKSKREIFANRLENIIKNTNNKYDLFKEMKNNNLTMKWADDKYYNNKLSLSKITITDNITQDKYRLETLVKKYNLNISNNKDLLNHFIELDKINKLKNERIIKNIVVSKKDLIQVNNEKELNNTYKELKDIIKNNKKTKYYDLNTEIKYKLKKYVENLYNNSNNLQQAVKNKTEEMLIKAKEIKKDLNYEEEEKSIKNKLFLIMQNKILNEVKYNKNDIDTGFLIKNLIKCLKSINDKNIDKANNINSNTLENEKKRKQDIKKAISY